ncbi:MAG: type II CAAX endopeptidase family protein [Gemmatimonadaceae bacterium]
MLLLVAWYVALGAFLFMRPVAATAWVLAIVAAFVVVHVRPGRKGRRRQARLGARVPRMSMRWIALVSVPAQATNVALAILAIAVAGMPSDVDPFAKYVTQPLGWLPVVVTAIIAAPIIEELILRGMMQRTLERRIGGPAAIWSSALLFAAIHLQLVGFLNRLALGLILGYAVYRTRSIWSSVLIHALINLGITLLSLIPSDDAKLLSIIRSWPMLLACTIAIIASAVALYWLDRASRRTPAITAFS